MNKKLYELMNWPEIEAIVYSENDKPKSLLGGHLVKQGFLVQVFRPDAVSVSVNVKGKKEPVKCEKVDEAGFFAALINSKKAVEYTLTIESVNGEKKTFADSYAIKDCMKASDFKAFFAGTEKDAGKILGSRPYQVGTTEGVLFSVWAPDAVSVSVVGDFNKYDGSMFLMQKISDDGIYELFIPGLSVGTEYLYEIKLRGGNTVRKLDPYGREVSKSPMNNSVVSKEADYVWSDTKWMLGRSKNKKPLSIYEVKISDWALICNKNSYKEIGKNLATYVKKAGYSYINFLPVAEYFDEAMNGYSSVNYYAVSNRFGGSYGFKEMINEIHKEGIGIIIDWNAAYFGKEIKGLFNFDGSNCYGYLAPRLEKDASWEVITFDYKKGAVKSFLMSNLKMWLDEYHIDGIRIDGVASMLYLDYGKQPGTWQPNIYGGNENLDAIDFLRDMNSYIAKRKDGVITIAEETSGWSKVTKANDGDNLGFDYKLNNHWRTDFVNFFSKDPLFRKGDYDKLVYSMLYNYSEDFIVGFTYDDFKSRSLYDYAFGADEEAKYADIRAAVGYAYMFPSAKIMSAYQDKGLEKYMADLNGLYQNNKPLYELNSYAEGFEWLENSNPDETVIAFARKDKSGNVLTVAVNFTPVERKNYRLFVPASGKYKQIFNSNCKKYGGNEIINSEFNNSDESEFEGKDAIFITLPASGMVIYVYEPYTEIELEEKKIIREAAIAKKEAEKRAEEARRLEEIANAEAEKALEAQKMAQAAAKAAVKAKEEAKKRAVEAEEASKMIDEKIRKRLEELEAMKKK